MITDLKINPEHRRYYYERGWWTDQTLNDIWNCQVTRFGSNPYVKDELGASFSYQEIDDQASRLASWFLEIGVKQGDVVSFQIPRWAEFAIIYVACLKAGAVIHPFPVNYSESDILYTIDLVKPAVYICPTFFHKTDFEKQ